MKLLLTAFDPFGGEKINPALEAVKRVQDKIGDLEIVKLEVPTVFYKSIDTVANAIEKEHPDVVLCIGQAGGRFDLTPERVAININDARIPDNEGNQPLSGSIFEKMLIFHLYQSKQWLLKLEKQIFLQVFLIQQELMYVTI